MTAECGSGRFGRWVSLAAAAAVATTLSGCGGHASSTRPPTPLERAALQQAIFDYVVAHTDAVNPSITRIRVSSVPIGSRSAASYTAFARVDLMDPSAGYAGALLGYRRKGEIPGWRVLDLGSDEVGCSLGPAVFGSHKQAVLRSLGLGCS
ncbi:MAG: hypothetical protein ABSB24_01660 [Gaiellaceae bacterium]